MGEIKSAIELAMERTSHMSLSKEEKAKQKKADFEKMLNGALQHYSDGLFSIDDLRDRIKEIQTELKTSNDQLIKKSVLNQIDPEGDNERWLDLLSVFEPAFHVSLQNILSDYHEQETKLSDAAKSQIIERLAQNGITGSAVVPNPEKDPSYQQSISDLRSQTQSRINSISQ
ncbi:MAG: hypothetical protein ABFD50_13415 [Smithella sp.]